MKGRDEGRGRADGDEDHGRRGRGGRDACERGGAVDGRTVLREHARRFRKYAKRVLHGGDAEDLHQARVESRRLREALSLFRAGLPRRRSRRIRLRLREVGRALGAVRNLDVSVELLKRLVGGTTAGASAAVLRRLRRRRGTLFDVARADLERTRARRLAKKSPGLVDRDGVPPAGVLDRLSRRARVLDEAFVALDEAPRSEDALHAVRIAAKKRRYSLEIAREAGHAEKGSVHDSIVRVQDALGAWRDAAVLLEETRAAARESARRADRRPSDSRTPTATHVLGGHDSGRFAALLEALAHREAELRTRAREVLDEERPRIASAATRFPLRAVGSGR
jgi:CHAD domain-containing protein